MLRRWPWHSARNSAHDYGLPAYILRTKDFPMRSYIRGTPPTAPSVTKKAVTRLPEAVSKP